MSIAPPHTIKSPLPKKRALLCYFKQIYHYFAVAVNSTSAPYAPNILMVMVV